MLVSSDPERHTEWLREFADLGFEEIYLHHVGQDQRRFAEAAMNLEAAGDEEAPHAWVAQRRAIAKPSRA